MDGLSLLGAFDDQQKTYMKRGAALGAVAALAAPYVTSSVRRPRGLVAYLVRALGGAVVGAGAGYGVARLK